MPQGLRPAVDAARRDAVPRAQERVLFGSKSPGPKYNSSINTIEGRALMAQRELQRSPVKVRLSCRHPLQAHTSTKLLRAEVHIRHCRTILSIRIRPLSNAIPRARWACGWGLAEGGLTGTHRGVRRIPFLDGAPAAQGSLRTCCWIRVLDPGAPGEGVLVGRLEMTK